MKFLVVEGTVREGRKSIHAARHVTELLDERHEAELFDPAERDIPYLGNRRYKDDETPTPEDVEEFGAKVEEADCIVLVAPEYNHSYPGVLKNLLDFLYPEYDGKPFSYVTVSAGGFGGVHALEDLESLTVTLGGIPGPSIPVSSIGDVFSEDGELADSDYEERFREFAENVVEHARKN
jgi:NAD(P)H-dependent FMN reductase